MELIRTTQTITTEKIYFPLELEVKKAFSIYGFLEMVFTEVHDINSEIYLDMPENEFLILQELLFKIEACGDQVEGMLPVIKIESKFASALVVFIDKCMTLHSDDSNCFHIDEEAHEALLEIRTNIEDSGILNYT